MRKILVASIALLAAGAAHRELRAQQPAVAAS
jgi:hypothetical protein